MSLTLIFCFDGTWADRNLEFPTNVLKLHRGLRQSGQVSFYFAGPGAEANGDSLLGELLGAAFGWGSNDIRDRALDMLSSVYRLGDRIAVIGFSRGAAVARLFCAKLAKEGVNGFKPDVDFLGCFDTVGAYLPFGPSQQGLFHDLHVSPRVNIARHAVALDEDRLAFEPNLMNRRHGVREVWFHGAHCDVGGGIEETGLSDLALQWMTDEMAQSGIQADVSFDPRPGTKPEQVGGFYRRGERTVGVKMHDRWAEEHRPEFHWSVDCPSGAIKQ